MRTVPRILPGIVSAVLLYAGCAAPTITVSYPTPTRTPTDKAVAEACGALRDAFNKAGTTLNTAVQKMGTDPQKALAAMQPVVDDLQKAVTRVDNPTVRAQAEKTVAALKVLVAALGDAADDPSKIAGLAAPFGKVRTELTAFGALCGG